jgi:inhibitor of KinA sporulation pathway (predicted exonuclease)
MVKLDQIFVVDIEATCWEKGQRPVDQISEIIEIGVCLLDIKSRQRLQKTSLLVKPQSSSVSPFCTELTTLTQEQVDGGISFAEACSILREQFASKQRVWASYGEYDRSTFQNQCEEMGVIYPFSNRHINVKTLFAIACALPKEVGMATALELLNLPLEGTHHRGGDDAWNIAQILAILLWQDSSADIRQQCYSIVPSD